MDGRDNGLKFLGSDLMPFLYGSFIFASLQSFGKRDNLMGLLQICLRTNASGPSFRNMLHKFLCLCRSFSEYLRWNWFELFEC